MSAERDVHIRLKRIIMVNFRNVEFGKIDFPSSLFEECREPEPSILGLYGQNGSGKTSLVMALGLLKRALIGAPLAGFSGCIRSGYTTASLLYEFAYCIEDGTDLVVNYNFNLSEELVDTYDQNGNPVRTSMLRISDEVLYFSGIDSEGNKIGKTIIADTGDEASKRGYAFGRDKNYEYLAGKDKHYANRLREVKAVMSATSRSFIFCDEIGKVFNTKPSDDLFAKVYMCLVSFGRYYLQIVDNHSTGINNMNYQLPLSLWGIDEDRHITSANVLIDIGFNGLSSVRESQYKKICDAIESLNEVLCKLVPGLQVKIEDSGISRNSDGESLQLFSLCSERNGGCLPLNCESDGIRRIISILSLLIGVYNQRSMTVVIDEIDSGIYEYLLGEILRIMKEHARGQLIFTSHNLRPAETLPSKFICFTTTNPQKRYVKLVKPGNSNLRDMYFKKIVLGSEEEQLYAPTDNDEIVLAFQNAGRLQDRTLSAE